jgi:cell division control protein 6
MPDTIFHRDSEQELVTQSLMPILKQSRPSNLLVYGKPGTGKTLVVKKILSKIQSRVAKSNFPIKLVYVNSKEETTLYQLLVSFGRQLGLEEKELPSTGLAISEVFKRLLKIIDKNHLNAVFVIDEIDYLADLVRKTGKDILYQLTRANERLTRGSLTFVGISNDLTFKERLDPRVLSTLGEEEIVFTTYSVGQIRKILEGRIEQAFIFGAVEDSALNLCSAMAGREHGDARRAIDLLRVAGEIAEREQKKSINEDHIRMAAKKIEENKEVTALQSFPLHEKLLIIAAMKTSELSTGEIYAAYKSLCKAVRQQELTQRRVTQMLSEIELSGIISGRIVHQGIHGNTKKYKLTIPSETIKETFKNDLTFEDIL